MLEKTLNSTSFQPIAQQNRKILRMRENDRTAGSMPSWEKASSTASPKEQTLAAFAFIDSPQSPDALAFQQSANAQNPDEEFGFTDFLDMINPLQHIPVVSYFYRQITGDTIKPPAQIIGGAVFGGALGAASGLINVVITEETGGDIAQNALGLAKTGKIPEFKTHIEPPQEQRTASYAKKTQETLPSNANSWARPPVLPLQDYDLANALLSFSKPQSAKQSESFQVYRLNT